MPLSDPRPGEPIQIKRRHVEFSLWPVGRTSRRYGLQSRVFASDPWSVIRNCVSQRCPDPASDQARAFQEQAEDYFRAADVAGLFTTKPLLLYYSLLNVAKTYALTCGIHPSYGAAFHGLTDVSVGGGRQEFLDSDLDAFPTTARKKNVFDDFLAALTGSPLAANTRYPLKYVTPQILQGHRLWTTASGEQERFIETARIDLMHDPAESEIWIVMNFYEDDLTRLGVTMLSLLRNSRLNTHFKRVNSAETVATGSGGTRNILKLEQRTPIRYSHRISDEMQNLVSIVKDHLWVNVLNMPPYRKYYVYLAPQNEHQYVLPQLASIFAVFYYLGSLTRYRPQKIPDLVSGKYGAFLQEIVLNLPNQFLYLLGSEFAQQDVTRAAIV